MSQFKLEYVKDNLFSADSDVSLAHCVSKDMKMGTGIATQFENIFGNIDLLVKQRKKIGEVAYLEFPNRYVFNLITKNRCSDKSTYDMLRISLVNLRVSCERLGVIKLAMPKMGCGLDKLHWPIVENIIKGVFKNTKIHLSIYHL